jgi:hypothetical protein
MLAVAVLCSFFFVVWLRSEDRGWGVWGRKQGDDEGKAEGRYVDEWSTYVHDTFLIVFVVK